jgi:hypothetical protein
MPFDHPGHLRTGFFRSGVDLDAKFIRKAFERDLAARQLNRRLPFVQYRLELVLPVLDRLLHLSGGIRR